MSRPALLWAISRNAVRMLVRRPRRSAMALAAVTFGIVALLLASGFIEWIYFDMRESTIRARLGHLQIVRPGYHETGRSDPFAYLLPADSRLLEDIRRTPDVRVVAPRLSFSGLASHKDTTISFVGEGVDPSLERQLSGSLVIDRGANLHDGDTGGALFGEGLARNLGVDVGDRVVLLTNTSGGGINAVEITVRGLFSTVSKAYDDSALRLPIETARSLLHVKGAHEWVVLLDSTDSTNRVAARIRRLLPSHDYQLTTWYDLADFYRKTVALFEKQVDVVRMIIGAIILLSISNSLTMAVLERTGEIGTAMALGATRRGTLVHFVVEGMLLGVVGGVIGVAVGWLLALAISAVGIPMPPPPGSARAYVAQIRITPTLAASGFALAFFTAIAASAYPAWRASRLPIVDALRRNR